MAWLEAFQHDCEVRGMAEISIRCYMHSLREFERFFRKPLQDVSKADIGMFIDGCRGRGLVTKSIGNKLDALSAFFEWAIFMEIAAANPVKITKKRYLAAYKNDGEKRPRTNMSIEDATRLVSCAIDIRNRCIIEMLLKTGVRKHELAELDISDIRWQDQSITLKATKKRSNRLVYFDNEVAYTLARWLKVRESRKNNGTDALFISGLGNRISHSALDDAVVNAAKLAGLDISPHDCRHWFTTELYRAGMKDRDIAWLRGDAPRGSMGTYVHIDPDDVRRAYLACIPRLGV